MQDALVIVLKQLCMPCGKKKRPYKTLILLLIRHPNFALEVQSEFACIKKPPDTDCDSVDYRMSRSDAAAL